METPPTPAPITPLAEAPVTPPIETPAASAGNGAEGAYVIVDGTGEIDKPIQTETGKITPQGDYVADSPQKRVG